MLIVLNKHEAGSRRTNFESVGLVTFANIDRVDMTGICNKILIYIVFIVVYESSCGSTRLLKKLRKFSTGFLRPKKVYNFI